MQGSKPAEVRRNHQRRRDAPPSPQIPIRASRVIRITQGTYDSLGNLLKPRETFNDVIQHLLDDHYNVTRREE